MQQYNYLPHLEKQRLFVINDLEKGQYLATANLLVAQSIFNNIEIVGGYLLPKGNGTDRFNHAIKKLFPAEYETILTEIKNITGADPYDVLRCGFTHEYLMRTYKLGTNTKNVEFTVFHTLPISTCINQNKAGIVIETKDNDYWIKIINVRLIFDLDMAFQKLIDMINSDNMAKSKFEERAKEINLQKLI